MSSYLPVSPFVNRESTVPHGIEVHSVSESRLSQCQRVSFPFIDNVINSIDLLFRSALAIKKLIPMAASVEEVPLLEKNADKSNRFWNSLNIAAVYSI
jgi:hypothetical protein